MPQPPRLDEQRLEIIQALQDPTLLADLIALFQTQTPATLARLREAFEKRDAKGVSQAAHSLKSQSGNLGAARLFALCDRLEDATRQPGVDVSRFAAEIRAIELERVETEKALLARIGK